jgi:hypothetical protein
MAKEEPTMIAEQDFDRVLMVLNVTWLALLGSLALYLVVGRIVAPDFASPVSGETFAIIRAALLLLGFVTLVAAKYVRRLILGAGGRGAEPDQDRQASLPQRYAGAVMASMAMSESVGVYGLVLYLLGKNEMDLYLLVGIAAAAMYYFRPRKEELLSLSQRGGQN